MGEHPDRSRQIAGQLDRSAPKHSYKFWETQPVDQFDTGRDGQANSQSEAAGTSQKAEDGPIHEPKTPADVRQEPYALISQFEWCLCDLQDPEVLTEVFDLLRLNYVEDDDAMFRFCYSREFLKWALCPPGYMKEWHIGVRVKTTSKLVGFITGVPANLRVNDSALAAAEINFLCVHKKLRAKRLTPLLIKEVTRRVNLTGVWHAAFTAGVVIPKPAATCRYYHRSLNPKKLIEVGFSSLGPRSTMVRTIKLHRLPEQPLTPGLRQIRDADFPAVTDVINEYLDQYKLRQHFDEAEVRHFLTPHEGLMYAYVVEADDGVITDVCSFYSLPSSILRHPQHSQLNAAYMYYTAATVTPMKQLLNDALIMARDNDFDVFNALNLLENSTELLTDLKFGEGDGNLHYYLYNWHVANMLQPNEVALILM